MFVLLAFLVVSSVFIVAAILVADVLMARWVARQDVVWRVTLIAICLLPVVLYLRPWLSTGAMSIRVPIEADDYSLAGFRAANFVVPPTMATHEAPVMDESDIATLPLVSAPAEARSSVVTSPQVTDPETELACEIADRRISGTASVGLRTANRLNWISIAASFFATLWAAGTLFRVTAICGGYWQLRNRTQTAVGDPDSRWQKIADELSTRGSSASLQVRFCSSSSTPAIGRFLGGIVLIPESMKTINDDTTIRQILIHERTHLVRGDQWFNLLLHSVGAVLWIHPLYYWMKRRILWLREVICDASVVQEFSAVQYAQTLLELSKRNTGHERNAMAVAMAVPRSLLGKRVAFLLSLPSVEPLLRSTAVTRGLGWLMTGIVCMLIGLVQFTSAAQQPGKPATANDGQSEQSDTTNENSVATANAKPSEPVVAPDEANAATEFWPEGSTVSGRVVDHTGSPVKNAEVLLLGEERIIVDADTQRWFVPERESPKPPSARTNDNGEFRITRENGTADRLGVISKSPLFWVIPRKQLEHADSVDVKLPPPGTLAIECDLPNEPSEIPVMIELTSFDAVTWKNDSLRFHMAEYSLVNRGKKVFEHLPPAHYAVQFYNEVQTGRSTLMTGMDRQLVEVTSEKQSSIHFDRKVGRPLSGRVLGLENSELRYARLTVSHAGPEEVFNKTGRSGRLFVAFDVVSIGSDGNFTTDPIPPGKYEANVFAVLDSTPELSSQSSDFSGGISFTIPEQGDLPVVEFTAKPNVPKDLSTVTDLRIRAVDEDGKPVPKMQAMIHTAEAGYGPWVNGNDGIAFLGGKSQYGAAAVDVIVRAEGYASAFARFEAEEPSKLSSGGATITLHRGVPVQLEFSLPSELKWPKETMPETYFDNMQERVRTMRQSVNRRSGNVVDFNILNLRDLGDGRFEFRIAEQTPQFHIAIHAPGFLQYFEAGTFTFADVKNDRIEIDVPSPGAIEVTFAPGEHAQPSAPFKNASLNLLRQLQGDSYLSVASLSDDALTPKLSVTDLAPGNYLVDVRTQPKDEIKPLPNTEINTGTYFDRRSVTLSAGQRERLDFRSKAYQPDIFRGPRTAIVKITTPDGKPAAGREIQVSYFDGHYGSQVVFEGSVPVSGNVELSGITDKVPTTTTPNRAYSVRLKGTDKWLGSFGFSKPDSIEEFEFFLTPGEGDLAPDVELINLSAGNSVQLSSFRGKVVLLEFWATWCGPCQQPMEKLNAMGADQIASWKDRVIILPVSIDGDKAKLKAHIQNRSWTKLEHFWSVSNDEVDFNAAAARAFVVSGVPEAILIGPDGRILWRGHPMEQFSGKSLKSRIDNALQ